MARQFIDLSIYLENDVISDPPAFAPKIQYFNHQNSFEQMAPFFPGLKQQDLPDGEVWADVDAGMEMSTPLTDQDLAGLDDLPAESLDAEPLCGGVATVA